MPGRYFRTHPGHGHTPRAILFRDIMLDSSSFLPADILVAIASNPLRQSVSAIRTPRGLLSFLFHLPSSPLHPLLYFRLFFFFSTHSSLSSTLFLPLFTRPFMPFHPLYPFLRQAFSPLCLFHFVLFPSPSPAYHRTEPDAFLISPLCAFRFVYLSRFFVRFSSLSLFPRVYLSSFLSFSLCLVRLFFNNLPRATMERPIYFQTQNFQLDSRRRSENSRVRRVGNVMQINDKSDRTRGCK